MTELKSQPNTLDMRIIPSNLAKLFDLKSEDIMRALMDEPTFTDRITARIERCFGTAGPLTDDGSAVLGRLADRYPDRHLQLFDILSIIVNREAVLTCTNGAVLRDNLQGVSMPSILPRLRVLPMHKLPASPSYPSLVPGAIRVFALRLEQESLGLMSNAQIARIRLYMPDDRLPAPIRPKVAAQRQAILQLLETGLTLQDACEVVDATS